MFLEWIFIYQFFGANSRFLNGIPFLKMRREFLRFEGHW